MQFVDLKRQYEEYKSEIDEAMQAVIDGTRFINGEEVKLLEAELSEFSGAKHSIGCASGTDALLVPLMAKGVKPGDEIIVPAFTYIATGTMVAHWGAKPVFVDVDPVSFNIDPGKIEEKITERTRGIFAVSLYGQPADFQAINALAEKHGLWVLEDGAQSFGARMGNKRSCDLSHLATTSFFPAKPLGCYGDGGAIFTDDDVTASSHAPADQSRAGEALLPQARGNKRPAGYHPGGGAAGETAALPEGDRVTSGSRKLLQ
jgi:UDP-2-acetamido-2-deoxy-ribo-hexuluronate aminotransferase